MNPLLFLIPQAFLLEANHASDIAQHFGSHPTNNGYSTVSAFAHWGSTADANRIGWYLDVGQGHTVAGGDCDTLHSVTQVRAGLSLRIR